jgi:capping protein alpha
VQHQEVVEEFVYYDPNKKLKFSFDPVSLEARIEEENVDWETQYLPANVVSMRDEIVKAMNSYLSTQYRKGTSEFAVYSEGDGSALKVEISCHNLNFKNYWGGEWSSTWTIDMNNGAAVTGHVRVHNHYFEQGNIQFNLEKDIPSQKPRQQTGRSVVELIRNAETKYQDGLEEMYDEISEKLLKGMRRIIPVTRTKFDWGRPNLL